MDDVGDKIILKTIKIMISIDVVGGKLEYIVVFVCSAIATLLRYVRLHWMLMFVVRSCQSSPR